MSMREILRVLLRSGSGRMGVALLAVLVGISLYVVATYPVAFGRLWNNPAAWADNPANVPPTWVNVFPGVDLPAHRVLHATEAERFETASGATHEYRFDLDFGRTAPPSFVSFSLGQVSYYQRPPLITVSLERPDGLEVLLLQHVVPGPRPDETPPFVRHTQTPLRVLVSGSADASQRTAESVSLHYGLLLTGEDLRGNLERALFGAPAEGDGRPTFEPLPGRYILRVEAFMSDPQDTAGEVSIVLGGAAFGLMGTDSRGRDLARGLLFGFPVALAIGTITAFLVTAIGTSMGILSGFRGGATDAVIQRGCDILTNIPLLPILIFLIFILGQRLWLVVVILVAFGWPGLTIMTRTMVLQIRNSQLVEATKAIGASGRRIMFRHILFQIAPFILAQMIFLTPAAILAEAGLSFLGLGDPSIPTWGQILEAGFRTGAVYVGYWWWVLPPGLLIVVTAMAFVFLTLGLEPVVNARLRSQ